MHKITGTYAMADWQEDTYRDEPIPLKLTRVHAHGAISGGLNGTAHTFYLIAYLGESGPFTGYTQFTGTYEGQEGSFTLRDEGVFDPQSAASDWKVVEGSGTGGFAGITGSGGFRASEGMTFDFTLDLTFPG